ncbi:hypothetical protein Ahy_B01g056511 [Arachis hypogaea]|uniref:Uncharacterized protein n=1 Tax=Arachis hypogaea TaxID=3818 RepID=A0A445AYY9_ARAHY|nr:hypothetical protein Ahy_B01g056511 [Arachis hypogaea]
MKSSGLRVLTIFRAFANQSGGFEMVGFDVKDIYNAIEKQRKAEASDTYNALKRVVVVDYKYVYRDSVVKTRLEELEQFTATVYTQEVFVLLREVLLLASNVRVVSSKKTNTCTLFEVAIYCQVDHGTFLGVRWMTNLDALACAWNPLESPVCT